MLVICLALTLGLIYSASGLHVDAGFEKQIPLQHPYMKVFNKYRESFGGANRIVVAISVDKGDIFTAPFFQVLRKATDEVFFLPGVNRAQVYSLFTPNVRFTEVVEDGISGGNLVPSGFDYTEKSLAKVRANLLKSNYVGRLVANDYSAALISAQLLEINPTTGEKLDYIDFAHRLETKLREAFEDPDKGIRVHIIGFAKVVGDIADGATRVALFFIATLVITVILLRSYAQSWRLTLALTSCALVAVIWQLGLLPLLGFGIDPMAILVPFLIFAIGVSHGVQMLSVLRERLFLGDDSEQATRAAFRRLLLPGVIALASDTIGFITIAFIDIQVIQDLAASASLGVALIIITNLILLPVLLSFVKMESNYLERLKHRALRLQPVWSGLSLITRRRNALPVLMIALALFGFGLWQATKVAVGDLGSGVPELRESARYNTDTALIVDRFSIGVDQITVYAQTKPQGCVDHAVMTHIDEFSWYARNLPGVQTVISLPLVARKLNAGWYEGNPKWRVLPRHPQSLAQAIRYIPTSTGLLNKDCSVMPVQIFTRDHKAETINGILAGIKRFQREEVSGLVSYSLAGGNVGVMAATNQEVSHAQFPMLALVFSAIIVLCLINFRSLTALVCVVLPLGLVSILTYALMALLDIGLKVNTLPVAALGVGIGVDYGIYIYNRLRLQLAEGGSLRFAYQFALATSGSAVIFTGLTLAVGVATWILSPLKFQADMGLLLTFMLLVNMLGAILLLPALAAWLLPKELQIEEETACDDPETYQ